MRSRWLVIGLIVSLALNLFLVGAGAGVIALGMRMAKETRPPGALAIATQAMPQPGRFNIRQMLMNLRGEVRADAQRSRAMRIQAWSDLASPAPNTAAIKQALAQGRQIDIAVRTRSEERVVDYVAGLAPADRAAFAAGMRQALTPPK